MPCYHPLPAWKSRLNSEGKRSIGFRPSRGFVYQLDLPCGKCIGCLQDRASEWSLRCEHEARLWSSNWFVTLTYAPDQLPPGGSLQLSDLQRWWKRLRKVSPGVRYFACGEYGEQFARPHYHALLFNLTVGDMTRRERLLDGKTVFESPTLAKLWSHGRIQVEPFSPAAAQYVCNYVRKKSGVERPADLGLASEFQVMSRRPGIGGAFIRKFLSDVYPDGFVTRPGGARRRAPRYYDNVLEKVAPRMLRRVKMARAVRAANDSDRAGKRLIAKESYEVSRNKFFDGAKGRPFEKGIT